MVRLKKAEYIEEIMEICTDLTEDKKFDYISKIFMDRISDEEKKDLEKIKTKLNNSSVDRLNRIHRSATKCITSYISEKESESDYSWRGGDLYFARELVQATHREADPDRHDADRYLGLGNFEDKFMIIRQIKLVNKETGEIISEDSFEELFENELKKAEKRQKFINLKNRYSSLKYWSAPASVEANKEEIKRVYELLQEDIREYRKFAITKEAGFDVKEMKKMKV